jgi:hypothetical protein
MSVSCSSIVKLAIASWSLVLLAGFGSSAFATKPLRYGECTHLKSQYTGYLKAYHDAKARWDERKARYYYQQYRYYKGQYTQLCTGAQQYQQVKPPTRPPEPPRRTLTLDNCWGSDGRTGWCRRNNCEPEVCYFEDPVTKQQTWGHGRRPPGGWKP